MLRHIQLGGGARKAETAGRGLKGSEPSQRGQMSPHRVLDPLKICSLRTRITRLCRFSHQMQHPFSPVDLPDDDGTSALLGRKGEWNGERSEEHTSELQSLM